MGRAFVIIFSIILTLIITFVFVIKIEPPVKDNVEKLIHYNFMVLLDLSDRISIKKNPQQWRRDSTLIKSIFTIFSQQVENKKNILSKDKFQVVIAPQPGRESTNLRNLTEALFLDMSTIELQAKTVRFNLFKDTFDSCIGALYRTARHQDKFVGADIWGFFQNNLRHVVYPSTKDSVRNVLFILTDGYIQFDRDITRKRLRKKNRTNFMIVKNFRNLKNWRERFKAGDYGLIPILDIPANLEVIVLEMKPKPEEMLNQNEHEILETYWTKWFDEMGVKKKLLLNTDYSAQQVSSQLGAFISPEVRFMTKKN